LLVKLQCHVENSVELGTEIADNSKQEDSMAANLSNCLSRSVGASR